MPIRFKSLPIRQKFMIPMVTTLAVMLLSVFYYFPNKQKQVLFEAYQLNAKRTAELISIAVAHALEQRSFDLAQKILRETTFDPNVSFIILTDSQGEQFAAFNPEGVPVPLALYHPDSVTTTIEKNMIIVAQKIGAQNQHSLLAHLILGYSLENLHAQIVDFRAKTVIFAIIAFFLGYIFIKLASVRITKSISKLQAHMYEIVEKERYSSRVDIGTEDEVGLLAATFNRMMGELEERRQRLQASQTRLRRAVRQLKKINRLKTVFVSDASHQLRTPLTIITGEVEVALQNAGNGIDCRETLRIIGEETRGLTRIVENLLSLAKADAGNLVFLQREIDFSEVCRSQARQASLLAKAKGLDLRQAIAPDCIVTGDPNRLAELVYNLLDNAIKYTPAGKGVEITLEKLAQHCVLKVMDEGVGIEEEELDRIFSRFYRTRNASKNAAGSGLGLAICKSIVKAHGGKIGVQSQLGAGSSFEVVLKLG